MLDFFHSFSFVKTHQKPISMQASGGGTFPVGGRGRGGRAAGGQLPGAAAKGAAHEAGDARRGGGAGPRRGGAGRLGRLGGGGGGGVRGPRPGGGLLGRGVQLVAPDGAAPGMQRPKAPVLARQKSLTEH